MIFSPRSVCGSVHVGDSIPLVRVYLLKLAQNLPNELLSFRLSLSLLKYSLALEVPVATTVRTMHVPVLILLAHAVNHCGTWLPWANIIRIFCPIYYFIWAYGALLHALPLPARSYALLSTHMPRMKILPNSPENSAKMCSYLLLYK